MEMSIFRFLNLVQLQLRSASESITWVGLNSNKVWLMKSLASEMDLRGEKRFSVTTLLNCKLLENDVTCILQGKSKCYAY